MAKQTINVGTNANDGTGDPLRSAMQKINSNFTDLYDNYQTEAGLSANVATLTAANTLYVGVTPAAAVVNSVTLAANLAALGSTDLSGLQTTAGLAANVLTLTANNSNFLGTVAASNYITSTTAATTYQTRAGLAANVQYLTANNSAYLNSKTENNLNVNNATYANSSYNNTFNIGTSLYSVTNGNIGIGTGSPGAKLSFGSTFDSSETSYANHINLYGTEYGLGVTSGQLNYGTATGGAHVFYNSTVETMRIKSTGYVSIGVGSSSAPSRLSVVGNSSVVTSDYSTTGEYITLSKSGSTGSIQSGNTTSYNILALNSSGGNVGIGTSTPDYKLKVISNTNSNDGAWFYNANTGSSAQAFITLQTNGASGLSLGQGYANKNAFLYLADNSKMEFSTNATVAMTIAANSNIGIGTGSPASKLQVVGTIRAGAGPADATNASLAIYNDGTGASIEAFQGDNSNTKRNIWLQGYGGNVGIGNTAPASKLTVAGTIETTTGGIKFPDATVQTSAGSPAYTNTFLTTTTWNKPSGYNGTSVVHIQCWGGGGGAGGLGASLSGGGGGGGYEDVWVTLSDLPSQVTATVGAGGTGGNYLTAGGSGGNTSFGSIISVSGGAGAGQSFMVGGGGGGPLSKPSSYIPAEPWIYMSSGEDRTAQSSPPPLAGTGGDGNYINGVSGYKHGGGGGVNGGVGAKSVWGGGGGCGGFGSTAGVSKFGGNGGATGTAGSVPGGGGGAGAYNSSTSVYGAGASGKIVITIFAGV